MKAFVATELLLAASLIVALSACGGSDHGKTGGDANHAGNGGNGAESAGGGGGSDAGGNGASDAGGNGASDAGGNGASDAGGNGGSDAGGNGGSDAGGSGGSDAGGNGGSGAGGSDGSTPVDECAAGTDNCDANAMCTDTPAGFTCACSTGFSGDGITCSDVDECSAGTANCDVNASCTNTAGSFTCTCTPGFTGDGVTCSSCLPAGITTVTNLGSPALPRNVNGTVSATNNYTASCTGGGLGGEHVYSFTAPSSAQYLFDTRSSNIADTVLSVLDPSNCSELACNDDIYFVLGGPNNITASAVRLQLTQGQTVFIVVDKYYSSGLVMSFKLNIYRCGTNQYVCAGGACIDGTSECDGQVDCLQADDEYPMDKNCHWYCNNAFYGAGDGCDCGCGFVDPDCADVTSVSCQRCNDLGSCAAAGIDCSTIKATDNTVCQ